MTGLEILAPMPNQLSNFLHSSTKTVEAMLLPPLFETKIFFGLATWPPSGTGQRKCS
jgi:hypothetical protein